MLVQSKYKTAADKTMLINIMIYLSKQNNKCVPTLLFVIAAVVF